MRTTDLVVSPLEGAKLKQDLAVSLEEMKVKQDLADSHDEMKLEQALAVYS